jgi:NO-binding membrane sensor protein with MHYT domain
MYFAMALISKVGTTVALCVCVWLWVFMCCAGFGVYSKVL